MALQPSLSGPPNSPAPGPHWPCITLCIFWLGWNVSLCLDGGQKGMCKCVQKLAYCTNLKIRFVAPPTFASHPAHHWHEALKMLSRIKCGPLAAKGLSHPSAILTFPISKFCLMRRYREALACERMVPMLLLQWRRSRRHKSAHCSVSSSKSSSGN